MTPEKRYELVARNTQEIIEESELKSLVKEKKQPAVYLGTSITGRPHVGYFVWGLKLVDFLNAGFKVKLLLADLHGALDNTPWDLLEHRYKYYSIVIPEMLKSVGADVSNFEIVKGSDFQLKKEYVLDTFKIASFATIHDCNKAASDVVKFGDNPKLSGLIYPIMQALDEQYLDVDIQFGGVDQRKIMMFARENLPKVGYRPRIEIMLPLIPGLAEGGKMSSSDPHSKIDLIEDEKTIKAKLNKAFCPEGQVEGNGVLAFTRAVIMQIKLDRKEEFLIERPEKYGGNLHYKDYETLEADFAAKKLHPMDLKAGVAAEINKLLAPIRKAMETKQDLIKKAYPQ